MFRWTRMSHLKGTLFRVALVVFRDIPHYLNDGWHDVVVMTCKHSHVEA